MGGEGGKTTDDFGVLILLVFRYQERGVFAFIRQRGGVRECRVVARRGDVVY